MKKLMIMAAVVCAAAFANAASVAWTCAGLNSYAGDQYMFFIEGQKGASKAAIQEALSAGTDVSDYAFGSGVVAANGSANQTAGIGNIDAGTYQGYFVLFDSDEPTAGESKWVILDNATGLTQKPTATTAKSTFAAANQGSVVNVASNWKSYGSSEPTPEPTSALLMLIGMAGLALRRKNA